MNIIVVGCGRVGSKLATIFSESNHNVVIIDKSIHAFSSLGSGFNGQTIVGVGFDEDVLIQAGVEDCDALAAVTNMDNSNLMIAEVARKLFGVKHVIARLYNPDRESAYMQLGLDYACGTSLVAEELHSKIMSGHGSHVDAFGEFEVLRFSLDLTSEGRSSIRASELERDHDIRIVAFERKDGSASSIPTKDSILYDGDVLLACVRHDLIEAFSRYIQD